MKPYAHPKLKDVPLESVLHALSDACRLAIVRTLLSAKSREMACHEIPLEIVKATRSHHLAVLRAAGLIFTRSAGIRGMTSLRVAEVNQRFPGLLALLAEKPRHKSAVPATSPPATPPKRPATSPRRLQR